MDDLFLLMVADAGDLRSRHGLRAQARGEHRGERYQHKEYRLDEEFEKHRRKRGDGGPGQGPMSLN